MRPRDFDHLARREDSELRALPVVHSRDCYRLHRAQLLFDGSVMTASNSTWLPTGLRGELDGTAFISRSQPFEANAVVSVMPATMM